jgi:valyl-tRNA synthetase
MPHDLPKAYDPAAIEDRWAAHWVRENLFSVPTPTNSVQNQSLDGQSFSILLPPPNVTGNLHMGHMFEHTESDILARWRRMRGDRVLWVPGTDHAGIATQMLVERQVVTEGTTRQQMGREAFLERVWEWKRHYGGAILEQMKRMGDTVDWGREYFTMSDHLSVAVREAFVRLYEQDLIYRGAYIVNWCPRCQTAISDLEVVHDEHRGHLWEIRYPVVGEDGKDSGEFLTVATTRPETMLGDVAVAIHPEDERYTHLHGKKLRLPLVNRIIPIVLDEWVSRDFGTGAVKVTPAHDPNDFAIGQRHHLPSISVMDEAGHINAEGGVYAGIDRFAARKRVVDDLEAQGLLAGIKDHTHSVGHCDRCRTIAEPRLSLQWFVAVNKAPKDGGASIAGKAIAAVKEGHIGFTPEMYTKTYLNWMENIHDWCISRQLWWGHRIPAWHCGDCRKTTVARVDPTHCAHCNSDKITQETDVLDTWFSSGLLPVSVFGWPEIKDKTRAGFNAFYPTKLLVTGFDILFFWVARMIMLGCWFSPDVPMPDGSPRELRDAVPFRHVYIHALVRDANREKMSKTKGNVVDPIEIVKQFGTDAVRFTLASMASPGTDIAFNVARTEGYRAFANKIWNAARFIFMNVDRAAEVGITVDPAALGGMPVAASAAEMAGAHAVSRADAISPLAEGQSSVTGHDFSRAENTTSVGRASAPEVLAPDAPLEARWIVAELHATAAKVNESLENYRFDEAANIVYQFFWGSFCDWYLEIVKLRLDFSETGDKTKTKAALTTLVSVFEAALRLLSPIMPFLTEELWHAVYDGNPPAKSIALAQYPRRHASQIDRDATLEMGNLQQLVTEFRSARKDLSVPEGETIPGFLLGANIEEAGLDMLGSRRSSTDVVVRNRVTIEKLARVSPISFVDAQQRYAGLANLYWRQGQFEIAVDYQKQIDVSAERERLTKESARLEKQVASDERQLGDQTYLAKAPAKVVEGRRKQLAENLLLLEKTRAALRALPPE